MGLRLGKKVGLLGMGALSVLGGLALPTADAAGADTAVHSLALGGTVRIKDDEVIARRDTYCNRDISGRDYAQLPTDSSAQVADTNNGCGGEVRVEVHVSGTLFNDAGWCVSGHVDLYEGTSESNHDLDGSVPISGCVGPGGSLPFSGRVRNTNEGGDWADYNFSVIAG